VVCIKKQPYIYYVRLTFKNRHFFRYLTCLLDRGHIITGGFDYVFYGDGEPSVSPFEHDEKLPQTFDPRTGTLKQDLTPSEYGNKVHSNLQKFNKDGGQFRKWREISTSECVEDYKRMLKRKRTYEKRPKGFAINVYDTNGNISSRRVFERLSSSEAEDLHLDYEGAYKFVKESRFDWQTESDFLIWR